MTPEEACSLKQDLTNHYGYIYCLTFPNGKKYVGQSIQPWKKRWRGHKTFSQCSALKNALYKYDLSTINWELIAYATDRDDLDSLEIHYIREFDTLTPKGYNLTEGGSKAIPISILVNKPKLTDQEKEAIKRLREENLKIFTYRRDWSDLGFNIISYLTTGNENICITEAQYNSRIHAQEMYQDPERSAELKQKLHEIQKELRGKPLICEETGEIFSCTREALEKHPEWNKEKINACCAKHRKSHRDLHFRYYNITEKEIEEYKEYWKEEMREVNLGSYTPRSILCQETGEVFPSIAAAARAFNFVGPNISRVCSGQRSSYKGFHFSYL